MLAENNEYIRQASETVYQLTQEEAIRQQCEAREDYYRRQRGLNDMLQSQASKIREQAGTIEKQADAINQLSAQIASLQKELNSIKQQKTE